MAILVTGNTFATNDQVTATTLNNIANSATFASGAVDGNTTQLSSGAIIVKDGGVSSSKLASSLVLVTPNLGTPSAGVLTNCTGTAAGLTAGAVTINANLTGDVTSVGNATSIASGVIVNADINASAAIVDTKLDTIATALKVSNSATTAASANTASAIVARDASGNFTAGTITANLTGTASNVTTNANLTGDVTSVGNATSIAAGVIVNADINASAAIVDTKLATITTAGKVGNSATTATSANTASAIVARDASGNFSAGTITATLTGTASAALASGLTGSTLASGVTASSLTSLGTITSINVTGGSIVGITDLAIADGGTGASTASAARTSLGVASAYRESIVTNVNQTGTVSTAMVFNTPGAPTVNLTVGKWLVVGTVAARCSDVSGGGAVKFRFSDNGGTNFFGAGCAPSLTTSRTQVTVQGYKDVTSGSFDVFFHATPQTLSTVNLGEATGISYAGVITAVKLEDTG